MKNCILVLMAVMAFGCAPKIEKIDVVKGADGTSCSVSNYYGEMETPPTDTSTWTSTWTDTNTEVSHVAPMTLLGAQISCTDGSSAIILNGANGTDGLNGADGAQGAQGIAGQNGQSCSVSRSHHSSYATISCPNSSPVRIYDGEDGEDGRDGRNGSNGTSCSVRQTSGGAQITCGNSMAFIYNGSNGTNGSNGSNGTSCSVSKSGGVATITCGNTSATVADGTNGTNGTNGRDSALADALGIAAILQPCGNEFPNEEVFMKLTDGRVLAVYDGGANLDRLAILVTGMTYETTDRNGNSKCRFQVNSSGNLINQVVTSNNGNN